MYKLILITLGICLISYMSVCVPLPIDVTSRLFLVPIIGLTWFAFHISNLTAKVKMYMASGKDFSMSDIVTEQKLNKIYDYHAALVLSDFLKPMPHVCGKGQRSKFEVIKPLPTVEEYRELKKSRFMSTVGDLVSDAFSAFEDLAGEIRNWHDALPENLQSGDKGTTLEQTADTLENLSPPDVPESISDLPAVFYPSRSSDSRSSRCSEACGMLEAAKEALENYVDNLPDNSENEGKSDAESLVSEIDNVLGDAENAEFPGMYG